MKSRSIVVSLLVAATCLLSCNRSANESATEPTGQEEEKMATADAAPEAGNSLTYAVTDSVAAEPEPASATTEETRDKTKADLSPQIPKLIKTGYLTLEVENYKKFRQDLGKLVSRHKGYLGNESESNETYRISNEITIRIPNSEFDVIMGDLEGTGVKTISRRIEVQDVGEEYADLQARIIAKKAVEKRYLDILSKANKISDILEVEEKLRVIREESEAAQGRVKYLENQVSFSTIYLTFYQVVDTKYVPESGPGFFTRIGKGFVKGWEGVVEVVIGMVYMWPLWVILAVVILLIRRRGFRFWPFRRKQHPAD